MEAIDASSRPSFALAANAGPLQREGRVASLLTPAPGEGATLEVRWIRPGALTTSSIEWFGPISAEIETREDLYFIGEHVPGVSLKIRGGVQLDLKLSRGTRGALDLPGWPRTEIRSWQKWSFPLASGFKVDLQGPEWVSVRKIRRIRVFSPAGKVPAERDPRRNHEGSCAVELTDVSVVGERWWTLGFEAKGRSAATPASILAAAGLVFADPLPQGLKLDAADAMSYADWLRVRAFIPSGG